MKTASEVSLKHLDGAGIAVSTICAIHCVAMPLIIGSLAASIGWLQSEALEWCVVAGSVAIGLRALLPSFRKQHRRKRCLGLFAAGMASILFGRLALHGSFPDTPFVVFGAALIISAHATNHYFCARCKRCG